MVAAMPAPPASIEFEARLLRPADPADASWAFLLLPQHASDRLPSRSMVSVQGTLAEHPFQATLEPDGQGSHWLKVEQSLYQAAGIRVGERVRLRISTLPQEPEPQLPADLQQALLAHPAALATWEDITARARRDWIHWIGSGKKVETRSKRILATCDMLAAGKRRACCFDRSGIYSKSMGAPQPAPQQ